MSTHLLRQARIAIASCPRRRLLQSYSSQVLHLVPSLPLVEPHPVAGPSHDVHGDLFGTPVDSPQVQVEDGASSSVKKVKSKKKPKKRQASDVDTSPARDPLAPTGVDIYLAAIQAAGDTPTLSDLERCRPATHADPDSEKYPTEYNTLVDTLCRSFSKAQLQDFMRMYRINSRSSRKDDFAECIIERQWKWPSLKEIERARRDRTEISTQHYPVTPSELFLILGKDGADMLRITMEYNVHISLVKDTLALRIEGLRGALKQIKGVIMDIKKTIVQEKYQLPNKTPLRHDLVQRISRLAGAYIENIGSRGEVKICAKTHSNLSSAKRLVSRAAYESSVLSHVPVLSYIPRGVSPSPMVPDVLFPQNYAMYPFLSPRSLPWFMNNSGAFRVRRVGQWIGPEIWDELNLGSLASGKGRLMTVLHDGLDLKKVLLDGLKSHPVDRSSKRVIKASTGHMLLTKTSTGQHASLIPPLKGPHQYFKILQWLEKNDVQMSFVPSLPTVLVTSPPTRQQVLHRLVYRSLFPSPTDAQPLSCARSVKYLEYEVALSEFSHQLEQDPQSSTSLMSLHDGSSENGIIPGFSLEPHCSVGVEADVDLSMPDRPMDIRFSISDFHILSETDSPAELQSYMANLRSFLSEPGSHSNQPEPPLLLEHDGDTYLLHTNASVRQSVEEINISRPAHILYPSVSGSPVKAVSESVLDLESNQKVMRCEVQCEDYASQAKWIKFLDDCDKLISSTYQPVSPISSSLNDVI